MMSRPKILSIEGNIGAGKTTIVENLQKRFANNKEIVFLREPVDVWDTIRDKNEVTILEKFYNDTNKYAFCFQVMAFATRSVNVKNAIKNNPECKYIICERSLEADNNIFAKMLKDDGKIEDIEYKVYEHFYKNCRDDVKLDGVIYIDSSPNICLERINKRSRDGEGGITCEYLENCKNYHDDWLVNNKQELPVIRIDTNEDVTYDETDKDDKGHLWIDSISQFIFGDDSHAMSLTKQKKE